MEIISFHNNPFPPYTHTSLEASFETLCERKTCIFKMFSFMHTSVFLQASKSLFAHSAHRGQERVKLSTEISVTEGCESPRGCWQQTHRSSARTAMFLTTDS